MTSELHGLALLSSPSEHGCRHLLGKGGEDSCQSPGVWMFPLESCC